LQGELARARGLVEEVVKGLGIAPKTALAKEDADGATWTLQRGSAAIVITLATRPSNAAGELRTYLRVVSPVLTLTPTGKPEGHEPLFKHLLELNAAGLANAAFGIVDQRVVAVSERPTDDLQAAEVDQMIRHLAAVADTFDDRLLKQFGEHARAGTG
jgi:Putative bacterial sensory transduction regulator